MVRFRSIRGARGASAQEPAPDKTLKPQTEAGHNTFFFRYRSGNDSPCYLPDHRADRFGSGQITIQVSERVECADGKLAGVIVFFLSRHS
jgi:hypothetical protein